MTDILCRLIKEGYGSYNEILKQEIHLLLKHYKWFMKDYEREMKQKQDYDVALMKAFRCPLTNIR